MKKRILLLIAILLLGIPPVVSANKPDATGRHERVGEKIVYKVKMGKISLGKAVFEQLPKAGLNGRLVNLVTFETKLPKFYDFEKIYSDPDTFLPLKVERVIYNWPFSERIVEDYDQVNFRLTIKKKKSGKIEEMVIKKKGPINNAILLPYFVRDLGNLKLGFSLAAGLPTQDFVITLAEKTEVRVPAGKFVSYHFVSSPKKIEIWISADERRIPLKIKGTGALDYTLLMQEYSN